jgi:hypothetical protein
VAEIFKHVKVKKCGYQLSEEELIGWLELYGRVLEPISRETFGEVDTGEKFRNLRYL